mgnify:FL=1
MRNRIEEYPDYLQRLFPQKYVPGEDKILAKTITFQVTDGCNLACTYCYQINKHHNFMDFETAKEFIDILLADKNPYINTKNSPGIIIEFIGGEPLLAIDLIDKITDYFVAKMIELDHPWATRFMLSMCSNGVLYFEPKVQEYLQKNRYWLSFSVSIDGNKKLHDTCRVFPDGSGSYDMAIAAAKDYMQKFSKECGSKMTLSPQNVAYTCEAVENLINLGYKQIFLNCAYEEGWTSDNATTLYYQLKKLSDYILENDLEDELYISMFENDIGVRMLPEDNDNWCGGNGNMIAVDYKGDIFPCLRFMESSIGDDVKPPIIGTVKGGIMSTPEQVECVNCLKCVTRRSQSTDECFNCPIAKGCGWCTAYNYQTFGTFDRRATFICKMHQARILANCYFWNSCYLKHKNNNAFRMNVPDEWALQIIDEDELNYLKKIARE